MAYEISEPDGLGHTLLLTWAPWARDDGGRESWSVKPRVQAGYQGDPPDEYWVVDKIVAPHKTRDDIFWQVVSREYLGEQPRWLMVREMGKEEWWIKVKLCWACSVVEAQYIDLTKDLKLR